VLVSISERKTHRAIDVIERVGLLAIEAWRRARMRKSRVARAWAS
jgi:hypothetical protein